VFRSTRRPVLIGQLHWFHSIWSEAFDYDARDGYVMGVRPQQRRCDADPPTGSAANTEDDASNWPRLPAPPGATAVAGVGLGAGSVYVGDQATDKIFLLDLADPAASRSFNSPAPNPAALAGPPISQVVVKIARHAHRSVRREFGKSLPSAPASITRSSLPRHADTSVMGTGISNAAPATGWASRSVTTPTILRLGSRMSRFILGADRGRSSPD